MYKIISRFVKEIQLNSTSIIIKNKKHVWSLRSLEDRWQENPG